ncbi:ribonuclease 3-like protein 2 isoform X1 [Cucumis melo]|uniref:Ribonuclease 3-like protein 2 isoform X1 n=1 Tax=Cucumis melo TaxID=3656 RepID=A0A1S3BMA5_CUCME|nr:ribonuclease 3-like protein 2 isoform X1 [Cucumis melo]
MIPFFLFFSFLFFIYFFWLRNSMTAIERKLSYKFKNKKLLEEALTHSSYPNSASYDRLEFIGDSAIGLAISNYFFSLYPDLDQGQLTLLRAANVSTEKLARVAVLHGLYDYVRRSAADLDDNVREFADAVALEDNSIPYGGLKKAPKVLADIVESVAGAIYVDVEFDLQKLWAIIKDLLKPIYTPEDLEAEPQPVTLLFEVCQKNGKQVDIKNREKGSRNVASVYVDGTPVASGSSKQKPIARLNAARQALIILSDSMDTKIKTVVTIDGIDGSGEIEGAMQKLHDFCSRKKWQNPSYSIEEVLGRPHEKRFVCSVKISTYNGTHSIIGDEKSRVKEAKNSAASLMIRNLQERKYL